MVATSALSVKKVWVGGWGGGGGGIRSYKPGPAARTFGQSCVWCLPLRVRTWVTNGSTMDVGPLRIPTESTFFFWRTKSYRMR